MLTMTLAAGLPAAPVAGAARELPVLKPSSVWNVDYGGEECKLQRIFGEGDDRVVLRLIQYSPGSSFHIMVSGKRLAATQRDQLAYAFTPGAAPADAKHAVFGGEKDGETTWQFRASFTPEKDRTPWRAAWDGTRAEHDGVYAQRLAEIRSIQFTRGVAKPVALDLGDMTQPMAAMSQCVDDLLASWGLDPAVQKRLQRVPSPKSNPANWIKGEDYPSALLSDAVSGIIPFRLMIDADGQVISCKIQALYTNQAFEKAVCPVVQKRARFEPALDADGRPVASVWTTSVNFLAL